ncbi:MAG: 2-C-methyl-D-erythritol 4-phosphate cytidylyltransferase [Chloroflexota bacterium]|jgi:2-C-methyl-D-erythritol 4-phosphate cytidylyltransferase|nr:2-C-methyl-D-erythritol 4-phosphate cytidylyltransferase [Chloroflexota bacterium]
MGSEGDKLLLLLRDRPVVAWAIEALEQSGVVDSILVVVSEHNLEPIARVVEETASALSVELVLGGARRQDSVGRAVDHLARNPPEMVLVHDGARPLVPAELVRAVLEAAREHGAATAGLPLKNACKEVDDDGFVRRSLERSSLVSVQTPQAFRFEVLARAHREGRAQGAAVDDDAELVERIGAPVKVVPGDYLNIKITTPDDVAAAEAHLALAPS